MGLSYRPMVSDAAGTVAAYEAFPWFGGIPERPGETETAAELEEMFNRREMVPDVSFYFLYEAADTMIRIENCKLNIQALVVQMLPSFYRQQTQLQRFNQMFKDQPVSREKLLLTIPMDTIITSNKGQKEIIERYLRNGIRLVLDHYDPEKLPVETIKAMGFRYLRLDPSRYLKQETANWITQMRQDGFIFIGGDADNHDTLGWLAACGAAYISGTMTGVPVSEDELIRDCLAREK